MEPCDRRDLVCLYLDALQASGTDAAASPAQTAAGIGDALEIGDTAAGRVGLLEELAALEADGLVTGSERPVAGYDTRRTVYALTDAGREHARAVRERVGDESVVVTNGTTETVALGEIDRYLDGSAVPLVTALARLTPEGRVPLDRHVGEQFVGREDELATVTDAIESSFTRDSRTVVVAGTAGMGKTALVGEAVDRVGADRDDLVFARGSPPAGAGAPYAPFHQIFEAIPGSDDLQSCLDDARADAPADDQEALAARRDALFERVADALRECALEHPIVVFCDNLHAADDATLALFAHLATAIDELVYPLAFVGAYRTPAVAATDHPLPDVLDRIDVVGRYRHVTLDALDRAETRAVLADVLGGQQLPTGFVDLVHDRTGGNPLFVRETATHLRETDRVDPDGNRYPTSPADVSLPDAVADQIDRRLDALDEPSRSLLDLGAVIGERIPRDVLAAASDLEPAVRREYVDVLLASRIWEPIDADRRAGSGSGTPAPVVSDDGRGDLQFVSGSLRDAVVDRLSPPRASDLHARVADALAAADDTGRVARIAHHREAAGDLAAAVDAYRRAGDRASDEYALADAIEHYERACSLAETADCSAATRAGLHADLAAGYRRRGEYEAAVEAAVDGLELAPERGRERVRLLGVRAGANVDRGHYDDARPLATRARELAADLDAPDLEARALRRLGVLARYQSAFDEAIAYFEESLDVAAAIDDRRQEALGLKALGTVRHRQGESDARGYFQQSLDVARDLADRKLVADNLGNLALEAKAAGEFERAREHLERCLEIYRDLGHRQTVAKCLNNLGITAQETGEYEEAREHLADALAVARDLDAKHLEARCLNNLGITCEKQGAYAEAREYHDRSLAIKDRINDDRGRAHSLENLGRIERAAGAYDEAQSLFEQSREIRREIGGDALLLDSGTDLGLLARLRGEFETAREHFEDALEHARVLEDDDQRARCLGHLGDVARERGATERAEELYERSLERGRDADDQFAIGRALAGRGALALARGDLDAAERLFADALAAFPESGHPIDVAELRLDRARLALAQGDPETARDRVERATAVFDRRDATHCLGRVAVVRGLIHAATDNVDAANDRADPASDNVDAATRCWLDALEAFETVGAPHDALDVIAVLLDETELGDDRRRELRDRARDVYTDAPPDVRDRYADRWAPTDD
jgi:predicted ATPase